jgi:hypothetical protein
MADIVSGRCDACDEAGPCTRKGVYRLQHQFMRRAKYATAGRYPKSLSFREEAGEYKGSFCADHGLRVIGRLFHIGLQPNVANPNRESLLTDLGAWLDHTCRARDSTEDMRAEAKKIIDAAMGDLHLASAAALQVVSPDHLALKTPLRSSRNARKPEDDVKLFVETGSQTDNEGLELWTQHPTAKLLHRVIERTPACPGELLL